VGDCISAELDSGAIALLVMILYIRLMLENSLLHDGIAKRISHGVALAFELERGGSFGGTGELR
jgi:hypothetical protein